MHKKVFILCSIAAVILMGVAGYTLLNQNDTNQSGSGTPTQPEQGQTVTKTGKVGCLVHKDTSGPVDAMCAIGLQLDDGTWYALGSTDPSIIGSIPTNTAVRVTGTLTTPSTAYTALGTISVASFETL
jgi:hypothetical protein